MWSRIKSSFSKPFLLNKAGVAVEVLGEFEQTLEAGQVITNIANSSNDEFDNILDLDDRLYITAIVIYFFSYLLKVIKYILQPNKNLTNTGNLLARTALLVPNILFTLAWIGAVSISTILLIFATTISFVADVFYNFIETIRYAYLALTAKTYEEARFFTPKIAYHAKATVIVGLIAVAYNLLSYTLAGASVAAAITATVIAAITVSVPFLFRFFAAAKNYLHSFVDWIRDKPPPPKKIKPETTLIYPPQAIQQYTYSPCSSVGKATSQQPKSNHIYYSNTIIFARPLEDIIGDVKLHIVQLSALLQQNSYLDRKQFSKRKNKISGLNLLLAFIDQINLARQQTKNFSQLISLTLQYQEICAANASKYQIVQMNHVDLSTQTGREQCVKSFKKLIQKQYPNLFSQFGVKTKHSYVFKLFSEMEAFVLQPDLQEIKTNIKNAKKEVEQWYKSSLKNKLNPTNFSLTLRNRTHPFAFRFLQQVAEALENNQLEQYVNSWDVSDNKKNTAHQDLFLLIEKRLRDNYCAYASFDLFGEGKLATIFNQLHEYYKRHYHKKLIPRHDLKLN